MQLPSLAEQLDGYRRYFPGPHLEMVLASMIAGNTAGELWAIPQGDTSPLLLLWDKGNNVFYLAGDAQLPSSLEALAATAALHNRPHAVTDGAVRFKARALSSALEKSLPYLFPGTALLDSHTLFLVHDAARYCLPTLGTTVANAIFLPITPDILSSDGLAGSDVVRAEICSMWPSEERFYQHGFGVVAVLEGEIICWCTSEYLSATSCGIGIATSPSYQGRGMATATASQFVREARERGVTAHWECDVTNRGSVRVADKVGFVRQSEETYWVGSIEQ